MMESAQAGVERNVAVVLKIGNDQKNRSRAENFKKQIADIEKFSVSEASKSSRQRLDVFRNEMKRRGEAVRVSSRQQMKAEHDITSDADAESRKRKDIFSREGDDRRRSLEKYAADSKRLGDQDVTATQVRLEKKSQAESKAAKEQLKEQEKLNGKLRESQAKHVEGNRKATESGVATLQGIMDLTEGLAILGRTSEENFEKFARGFVKVQASFKALRGFTEIIWKGRDAFLAMKEAQEGVAAANKLIAAGAVAGGVGGGLASGGLEIGAEVVAGAAGRRGHHKVAKEAAELAAERVAKKTGGGMMETVGIVLANYFGARGFGGAGKAAVNAGKGAMTRVGGATVGGAIRGIGSGIVGAGRGAWALGGGLMGKIGGMSLAGAGGLLAAGTIGAGILTEGIAGAGRLATGRGLTNITAAPTGPQQMGMGAYLQGINPFSSKFGLYNESPTGAAMSTYGAFKDMFSSGAKVEQMEQNLETQKEKNKQQRERQKQVAEFQFAQRDVYSNVRKQRISMGPGTELEKSSRLEMEAIKEVSRARIEAQQEYQNKMDLMYRNEAYNNEVTLMNLSRVRDKQSELVEATKTRLDLLKAENEERKRAVETSKNELTVARDRLKVAEEGSRSDRDSQLASFDRLSKHQKREVDRISIKAEQQGVGSLSKREIEALEKAGVGRNLTQRYRADSSRGYEKTLERLGDFKDSDKTVADAQKEEAKVRRELQEAVRKEKESRDKVAEQTDLLAKRFEALAAAVEKVTKLQSDQAGVDVSGAGLAEGLNSVTDSGSQNTMRVISAVKNMKDQQQRDAEILAEAMEEQRRNERIRRKLG